MFGSWNNTTVILTHSMTAVCSLYDGAKIIIKSLDDNTQLTIGFKRKFDFERATIWYFKSIRQNAFKYFSFSKSPNNINFVLQDATACTSRDQENKYLHNEGQIYRENVCNGIRNGHLFLSVLFAQSDTLELDKTGDFSKEYVRYVRLRNTFVIYSW